MYLFHPTSTLAVYILFLLVRVKALPSLVQRAPTDLRNKTTIELDDIRDILVGSKKSPPTGKVTLEADARLDMDKRWLVYDVKGLVDGDGKPITATATTRADGDSIDPKLIDEDVLLGYGHDGTDNQRWWMLESKIPNDIRAVEKLDIQLNYVSMGGQPVPVREVTASNDNTEDTDRGLLFFTIPKWVDGTEVDALTRVNGGKIDPDLVQAYKSEKSLIIYGYETMKDPSHRQRWWLVSRHTEFDV